MVIARGDIWWADLGEGTGSAPSYRRPVLVIQDNAFNSSKLATVIVLALTSNTDLAKLPGNVYLSAGESGLPKDSVLNVTQLATLDKSQLLSQVGTVPFSTLQEVEAGLALVIGLTKR